MSIGFVPVPSSSMFTVVLSALIRRLLHFSNLTHVIMISSIFKISLKRNRTIITMEHFPFGFDCFWWIARYLDANARIGGGESLSKRRIQTKHPESSRQVDVVVHVHCKNGLVLGKSIISPSFHIAVNVIPCYWIYFQSSTERVTSSKWTFPWNKNQVHLLRMTTARNNRASPSNNFNIRLC